MESDTQGGQLSLPIKRRRFRTPTKKIVSLVALGYGTTEIARILRCSYDTVWRRQYTDPDFAKLLGEAMDDQVAPIVGKVIQGAIASIETLVGDLASRDWQARQGAARTLLEVAGFRKESAVNVFASASASAGTSGAIGESAADATLLAEDDVALLQVAALVRSDSRRIREGGSVHLEEAELVDNGSDGELPASGDGLRRDPEG